jgi:hypothetical protein
MTKGKTILQMMQEQEPLNDYTAEEICQLYCHDGPMPCKLGFCSDVVMRLAWRSPYWDKRNITECVPPGEKVYVN